MKKKIKQILLIAFITYVLAELICFATIKTGYIKADFPHFFSNPKDSMIFPFTYADINKNWGVWHYNYPIKAPLNNCIEMECTPNSVGARDKERQIKGDTNRVVVLGDSFMEGFGIATSQRVSNLLENNTGRQFLNFACADMGSTQEYLVYKYLANQYDHNTVLIGILPRNDFLNDTKSFDSVQQPRRYKPYWSGTYPNMQIGYYVDHLEKSEFNYVAFKKYKNSLKYRLRYFFTNTTCWFNIVYFIARKKATGDYIKKKSNGHLSYSGYYDFTHDEILRLQQSLLSIKQIARGKKVVAFTIPVADDYIRFQQTNIFPPVVNALDTFSKNAGIIYFDLLTSGSLVGNYKNLFFDCDMHWTEKGNQWAAKQLFQLLK